MAVLPERSEVQHKRLRMWAIRDLKMSKTMAVHVRYKSLYISLPSSAKQREIAKFCVFWRTRTAAANVWYFNLEFND